MEPDRIFSAQNDKFGARFNRSKDSGSSASEPQAVYHAGEYVVSPPMAQESFGISITKKESGTSPDARRNVYDPSVSPGDESYDTRTNQTEDDVRYVPPQTPYDPPFDNEHPYDPPNGREAQIAMHSMDEPPSATASSFTLVKNGDYGYVRQHTDSDKRSLLSVAKKYDHRDSRMFLIKTGSYRFSITLLFCILIALSLKAFAGFKTPRVVSKTQVRVFNALMIGLSLGLGLNLASSLKRYAVILRWSLLTKRYVALEVFDLILGLETLTKVGKLMVISLPGIRKLKFLKKFPWFRDARDDGTRFTWIVCLAWLLINIGAQVLVAALSLFWPVNPSDALPLLSYGNVSVSDLKQWAIDPPGLNWNASALQAAWSFGNEATSYPEFNITQSQRDLSSLAGTPLYRGDGFWEYRFLSRNPEHLFTNYMISTRKVQARASCTQMETEDDSQTNDEGEIYIMARVSIRRSNIPMCETSTYTVAAPRKKRVQEISTNTTNGRVFIVDWFKMGSMRSAMYIFLRLPAKRRGAGTSRCFLPLQQHYLRH